MQNLSIDTDEDKNNSNQSRISQTEVSALPFKTISKHVLFTHVFLKF